MTPSKQRQYIRMVSRIKAQGHPHSNVGVRHIVGWLSTRPSEEFIDFLQSHYPIYELFHTDDYQTAFYRLTDRRTLGVDANRRQIA